MERRHKVIITVFFTLVLALLATAIPFTPTGDIDLKDVYNINRSGNITVTNGTIRIINGTFLGDGRGLHNISISPGNAENLSVNISRVWNASGILLSAADQLTNRLNLSAANITNGSFQAGFWNFPGSNVTAYSLSGLLNALNVTSPFWIATANESRLNVNTSLNSTLAYVALSMNWTGLNAYPGECAAGTFIGQVNDTPVCYIPRLSVFQVDAPLNMTFRAVRNVSVLDSQNISAENISAGNLQGNLSWSYLRDYPAGCSSGLFVSALADSPTCSNPLTSGLTIDSNLNLLQRALTNASLLNATDVNATNGNFGSTLKIAGVNICRSDGTNCPAAIIDAWNYTDNIIYLVSPDKNVTIGGNETFGFVKLTVNGSLNASGRIYGTHNGSGTELTGNAPGLSCGDIITSTVLNNRISISAINISDRHNLLETHTHNAVNVSAGTFDTGGSYTFPRNVTVSQNLTIGDALNFSSNETVTYFSNGCRWFVNATGVALIC